ncbi:MAG: hypothetical protein JRI73_04200 [Deltaproteobacteria bacterium]|nr:hypothetical protein [Deltaproteobacteria bacterium]
MLTGPHIPPISNNRKYNDKNHADCINQTFGRDLTLDEVTEIGCRIHMLERAFNCWEGLRRKDDRLPLRFLHKDIPSRNSKGLRTKPEELQEMLAYNVWRYMKIMAQVSTSNNKIDSKGLSGIATNTIRIMTRGPLQ